MNTDEKDKKKSITTATTTPATATARTTTVKQRLSLKKKPLFNNFTPAALNLKKNALEYIKYDPASPLLPLQEQATATAPPSVYPVVPEPWIWKCHRCRNIWKIGATQRCLSCSHRMCLSQSAQKRVRENEKEQARKRRKKIHEGILSVGCIPAGPRGHIPPPPPMSPALTRALVMAHGTSAKARTEAQAKKRSDAGMKAPGASSRAPKSRQQTRAEISITSKQQRLKMCVSEFDYVGWLEYNEWRKEWNQHKDNFENDNSSNTTWDGDETVYDGASVFDDTEDTDYGDLIDNTSEGEQKTHNEKKQRDTVLQPTQGRLHVVGSKQDSPPHYSSSSSSSPLLFPYPQLSPRDCWNDCNYPSDCAYRRLKM